VTFSPALTGSPSTYTVPSTGCRVGPPLHPATRATAAIRTAAPAARLVVTDHLPAADGGVGPVGVQRDRLLDVPDRPVGQGELQPAWVPAAERVAPRPVPVPGR